MTLIETQRAFLEHCPVVYENSAYDYIVEISFRKEGDPNGFWRFGWNKIPDAAKNNMELLKYSVSIKDENTDSLLHTSIDFVSLMDPAQSRLSDAEVLSKWHKLFTPKMTDIKQAFFKQLPIKINDVAYDYLDKITIEKVLSSDRPWEWDGQVRMLARPAQYGKYFAERIDAQPIENICVAQRGAKV